MKQPFPLFIGITAIVGSLLTGAVQADDNPAPAMDRGDRINERLDRRGERINERLDNRGDRIDQRLDRRGDAMQVAPAVTTILQGKTSRTQRLVNVPMPGGKDARCD